MIAKILVSSKIESRIEKINQLLDQLSLKRDHPDVLYFEASDKLGVEQTKRIKEFFSIKPYSAKGRVAVSEDSSSLTAQAQNSLLKTIEELPEYTLIVLGVNTPSVLLPTVLSRCQIIMVEEAGGRIEEIYKEEIEKLLAADMKEKFEYIEKLKDKEGFLRALVNYFHQDLKLHPRGVNVRFLKTLMETEEWAKQNVAIRAILEYLMLVIPSKV